MTQDTQTDNAAPRDQRLIDAIKLYLRLGLAVIPVPRGEKRPEIKWGAFADKRPTHQDWNAWWKETPGCNLAVIYSSSAAPEGKQLVCVDTDTPEAEAWVCAQTPLPPTATASTAKGKHRYYYAPAGLTHYQGGDGMPEVRAGVHFSILPPSVHPTGILYEWDEYLGIEQAGIADLPPWGVALMGEPEPVADGDAEHVEQQPVPEGRRNDTLFRQCAKWRAASVPDEQLRASAHAFNKDHCTPPLDANEVDSVVKSVLRYAPGTSARVQERARQDEYEQVAAVGDVAGYYAEAVEKQAARAVNAIRPPVADLDGAKPIADHAAEIFERVEQRRNLPRKIYGMRTGWPSVDNHFLGFQYQGLIWVGAETGGGKTTFSRHTLFATLDAIVAEGLGQRVVLYALEGRKEDFFYYWMGWRFGFPLRYFMQGGADQMTDAWNEVLIQGYSEFPMLPFDLQDGMRDPQRILWDIERRAAQEPLAGVIIENVQLFSYKGGNQWVDNQSTAMAALDLSDKLHIPIIVLSQVNTGRDGTKPRGGPEWKNNATLAFMVERGETGDGEAERKNSNLTRLLNVKSRDLNGCMPPLRLIGDRKTGRLYEEAPAGHIPQSAPVGGANEWPGND